MENTTTHRDPWHPAHLSEDDLNRGVINLQERWTYNGGKLPRTERDWLKGLRAEQVRRAVERIV
jgi:hypothetical protein